ncbi:MAG: hypothetical protein AAGA54_01085 [Myxococcota bacterium]
MNTRTTTLLCVASLLGLTLGCGVPCDMLEDKLCEGLGEADCKVWKSTDAPAKLREGRRATKACGNAMMGPAFDAHLAAAKAIVEAQRAAGGS